MSKRLGVVFVLALATAASLQAGPVRRHPRRMLDGNAYRFWLNVSSAETTGTTAHDRLFVELRSSSGALLATLATHSNLDQAPAGVYTLQSLSLAAFQGQTLRVEFRATTDGWLATSFRVDDVSLQ